MRLMRKNFLPFAAPQIDEEAIAEVVATLRGDWITTGPRTKAFEAQFGEYLGAISGTSVMLNSCTAGLHCALVALGMGPDDEVILPTLTFAATANVIEHVGARPVFVDVQEDTLCIDPAAVERAITSRTRAIVPVHLAGHPAALDEIFALSKRHSLAVLEDAAHALPAWYKGRMIGSRSNFSAFSFYATKNITTGEGGALTGDPEMLDTVRVLSLHGLSRDAWKRYDNAGSWRYDVATPGFKYNMTDIQAALGAHQLRRLETFHQRRQKIARRYTAALAGHTAFQTPVEREEVVSSWHLYILRLHLDELTIDRDEFMVELNKRKIGNSVHFIPLHLMSFYRLKYQYQPQDFPVAYNAFQRSISLPLYPRMTDEDVEDVIESVLDIAQRYRRVR